jgi:hypothetical protein
VGPRAVLDAVVKREIPSPRLESNPRTPMDGINVRICIYICFSRNLNEKDYYEDIKVDGRIILEWILVK